MLTLVSMLMLSLLVIDMVRDSFDEGKNLPITPLAKKTIGPINRLSRSFRERGWPVVFATDAFHEEDFIFKGKMQPYSLAGTPGAEVIDELEREEQDLWLPKPRFSAFFGTNLEEWLKERGVTLCAVAGITTVQVVVLAERIGPYLSVDDDTAAQ